MMLKFIKNYFQHNDERGWFRGLINKGKWEEINIIKSNKGSVRGNHYHTKTVEIFIILEGRSEVILNKVLKNKKLSKKIEKYIVKEGDVFLINKNINHTFHVIEESKWINLLSPKISKKNLI